MTDLVLPQQLQLSLIHLDWAFSLDPLEQAYALMGEYIPAGTTLTIEENPGVGCKYIFRLLYTSVKSGRKMCMCAKGDTLPTQNDSLLRYYLLQLVLTPAEQGREFSRLYFLEKRARQDAFLSQGKLGNLRVSEATYHLDTLTYDKY